MSPKNPKRPAPPKRPQTQPASGTPEGDRIAKVLARAGVASRRDAERMIAEGRVSVNGQKIDSPALNVTDADRILVDERPIGPPERTRLWLYHKPTGLVTTAKDEQGRETIFDALPEDMPRVMSVGRLDLNSEGLLLLTNDGALKRRLELPEQGWVRKYRVRVRGNPSDESLAPLREGVVLNGEHFLPMAVSLDRHQGANAWLTVGLREGKNREIRRAMESIGLVVNRLIRVSYGPFLLGKLGAGEVEELRPKVLRDQLGIEPPEEEAPAKRVIRKGRPARSVLGGAGRPGKPAGPARGKAGSSRVLDPEDMGERPRAPHGKGGDARKGSARGAEQGAERGKAPGGRSFGSGAAGSGRGRGPEGKSSDGGKGRNQRGTDSKGRDRSERTEQGSAPRRFKAGSSSGKVNDAGRDTGERPQGRSGKGAAARPGKPQGGNGPTRGGGKPDRTGKPGRNGAPGGKPPRGGPRRG